MGATGPTAGTRRRSRRLAAALDPAQRRRAALLLAAIVFLHLAGFFLLFAVVVPHHYALGGQGTVFGVGVGLTAYALGMRHAFDIDHIAAIDCTTRKLMADGQRPLSVGFFFSLGHSSVVFALAAVLALGVRGLSGEVADDGSALHDVTGVLGPLVSGTFLVAMGLINLAVLVGIVRMFRRARSGELDDAALNRQLDQRGVLNRLLGRATRAVRKPWHMYPLGLLFGLGFDTATEVALLATAGAAATTDLPFYAILCLPILFAAGMTALDTLDGAFMSFAYGWAFASPARKLFYNIAVTALSVGIALVIGTIEVLQVLAERLGWHGGAWDHITAIDFNALGYVVVGLFVTTWAIALTAWRLGRFDERAVAPLGAGDAG